MVVLPAPPMAKVELRAREASVVVAPAPVLMVAVPVGVTVPKLMPAAPLTLFPMDIVRT